MALIKPKLLRVTFPEKEVKEYPSIYKLNLDLIQGSLNDHDCSCGCSFVVPKGYIAFIKKDSTLDKEMLKEKLSKVIVEPHTRLPLFSKKYSKPSKKNNTGEAERITIYLLSTEKREIRYDLDDEYSLIATCSFSEKKALDNISVISDNIEKYTSFSSDFTPNGDDFDIAITINSDLDDAILDRINNNKTDIQNTLSEKEGDNPRLNADECLKLFADDNEDDPILKILSFAELSIQKVVREKESNKPTAQEPIKDYNKGGFLSHIKKPEIPKTIPDDKEETNVLNDMSEIGIANFLQGVITNPDENLELTEEIKGDDAVTEVGCEPIEEIKFEDKVEEEKPTPVLPVKEDTTPTPEAIKIPEVEPINPVIAETPASIKSEAAPVEEEKSEPDEDELSLSDLINSSNNLRIIKEVITNRNYEKAEHLIADYLANNKANSDGEMTAALWLLIHIRNRDRSLMLQEIAFKESINVLVTSSNEDISKLLNIAPKKAKENTLNYFFKLLKGVAEKPFEQEPAINKGNILKVEAWVKLFNLLAVYYDEEIDQVRNLAMGYIHKVTTYYKIGGDERINVLNKLALCCVYGLDPKDPERKRRNDDIARIIEKCAEDRETISRTSAGTSRTSSNPREAMSHDETRPRTPVHDIRNPRPGYTPPPRPMEPRIDPRIRRDDPLFSDSRLEEIPPRSATPPRRDTIRTEPTASETPVSTVTPRVHESTPRIVTHTPVLHTVSVSDDLSDNPRNPDSELSGLKKSRYRDRYYTSIVFLVLAFILSFIAIISISAFSVFSFILSLLALIVSAIIHPKVYESKYLKKELSENLKKILFIGIPVACLLFRIILLVVKGKNEYEYLGDHAYTSILVLLIISLIPMIIGGFYHIGNNTSRDHRRHYSFYRVPVKVMSCLCLTLYDAQANYYIGSTNLSPLFVILVFITIYLVESLLIGLFGKFNKSGK